MFELKFSLEEINKIINSLASSSSDLASLANRIKLECEALINAAKPAEETKPTE